MRNDVSAGGELPARQLTLLPVGAVAARLAEAVGDVIVIAGDDRRAEQLHDILPAFLPDARIAWLPAPDALPTEAIAPSAANVGRRAAALDQILGPRDPDERLIVVTTAEAASRLLPAAGYGPSRTVAAGDAFDAEALGAALAEIGYVVDDRIDEPGEMALRGGVLDLFPPEAALPVRIEHAEGRITAIRRFDPVTQRGQEQALAEPVVLRPAREAEDPGAERRSLFDLLPGAALACDPDVGGRRAAFLDFVRDAGARIPLLDDAGWNAALARDTIALAGTELKPVPRLAERRNPDQAARRLIATRQEAGDRVVIAGAARDLRFLSARLKRGRLGAPAPVDRWAAVGEAAAGALLALAADLDGGWSEPGLLVLAAADIIGSRAGGQRRAAEVLSFGSTIGIGDTVIHEDHGVGVLRGIDTVEANGVVTDAVRIEFARGAVRLTPVAELDRVWRYGAEDDAVTLDKLDGSSWEERRAEVAATVAVSAKGLVALAEERAQRRNAPVTPPAAEYERFAGRFGHPLTPDQAAAVEAVRADLAGERPMERLVVGDVGYGKTEVALRAAAMVALSGRQVAVVAPTTVLVRQHIETFRRRFAPFGIAVEGLSRLSTPAEAKAVKVGLADGSVRVVVGTQAVAGKGVDFADLGLVVIDEEQRFGTADKAKLRALGENTNVLTLTATPIPRTLQGALVGLQELSLITTPPARRQPIRTAFMPLDEGTVRGALLRERARGGQSFVVVPRIEDMAPFAARLAKLVPELTVVQAHGKMKPAEIDAAMVGFAGGEGDVLLATNIIEAGLDVPRANTMLVWHADRFGLSQLHQLRGRVGRGERRGQVLLLTEADADLPEKTVKRLRTLEALDRLGAGFAISARDLDLRGAGDLLGEEQAGHMKLVGIDLYQQLLARALRHARGEAVDDWRPDLHLGSGGRLPESWLPEPEVRIDLYTRLARLGTVAELEALAAEVEDRFGEPPAEAALLFEMARLRILAHCARIERVDAGPGAIALTPRRDFAGDAQALGLTEKKDRLLLAERIDDESARRERVGELLSALCGEG